MSLDSLQQVNKIVQENNEVLNCTWVLRYHKCFQLWITVKWPRSYILNITRFYKVVRISKILCSKMKVKTLREKIKKSAQRTLRFRFIHENFWKSLGCISSKNVPYSKLKLSTFSPLELFVELRQFLSGATKVSNKIRAVELTSMNNSIC